MLFRRLGYFDPAAVYDHFGEILAAMNIAALAFCSFLVVKGYLLPSSSDRWVRRTLTYSTSED